MSRFVVIGASPPTTLCNFTISFSLPPIRKTRSLFTASNLLLVTLSSAARDLSSVFDASCSLIISRSLFTLLIDSAILLLSAVFVFTSLPVVSSSVYMFAVPSSVSCFITFIFCLKSSYLI